MSAEDPVHVVYVVFAEVHGGVSHDFLAAYSSPSRAQSFIDEQDAQLRLCLVIREVEIDRHPSDDFWKVPAQGDMASAFHLLAGMPEDATPGGRGDEVYQLRRERAAWAMTAMAAFDREREREAVEAVMSARDMTETHAIAGVEKTYSLEESRTRLRSTLDAAAARHARVARLYEVASSRYDSVLCKQCARVVGHLTELEWPPVPFAFLDGRCDVCGRVGKVTMAADWRGEVTPLPFNSKAEIDEGDAR